MSRAEDCLDAAHLHVGVCQRAGYANGRADVIEELESTVCETCGAVVADGWQARHAGWHEGSPGAGICGDVSRPVTFPGGATRVEICQLKAGHAGWHHAGNTDWGYKRWHIDAHNGENA